MQQNLLKLTLIACLGSLAGCGESSNPSGNDSAVGIIDLDEVAKRLGRDKQMANSIRRKQSSVNGQIAAYLKSSMKQISEKRKEFGEQASDDQKQLLEGTQKQARLHLNQLRLQAQNSLNQHRTDVLRKFREEVRAAARKVAAQRSLNIVLTKNDTVVFMFESVVNITDDVVEKMLGNVPPSLDATTVGTAQTRRHSQQLSMKMTR